MVPEEYKELQRVEVLNYQAALKALADHLGQKAYDPLEYKGAIGGGTVAATLHALEFFGDSDRKSELWPSLVDQYTPRWKWTFSTKMSYAVAEKAREMFGTDMGMFEPWSFKLTPAEFKPVWGGLPNNFEVPNPNYPEVWSIGKEGSDWRDWIKSGIHIIASGNLAWKIIDDYLLAQRGYGVYGLPPAQSSAAITNAPSTRGKYEGRNAVARYHNSKKTYSVWLRPIELRALSPSEMSDMMAHNPRIKKAGKTPLPRPKQSSVMLRGIPFFEQDVAIDTSPPDVGYYKADEHDELPKDVALIGEEDYIWYKRWQAWAMLGGAATVLGGASWAILRRK